MENLRSPCANHKLFMSELLPERNKIIYLDTDVILLRSIRDLWKYFEQFNNSTLVGAAPGVGKSGLECLRRIKDAMEIPVQITGQIRNPGVMLMDLDKLRQSDWLNWIHRVSHYTEFRACPPQVSKTCK